MSLQQIQHQQRTKRTAIATFDSFEFKVEHFVVHPVSTTRQLDFESSRVLIVASTYDLKEFILISPADLDARRLVGTTRIRLLLSSIEMALATSKCELPVLVSYGNDKLYHGLRLSRKGFTESLPPLDNLVPDSGLKKIEYAMGPTQLLHAETHLARLRDIFFEKVGTCENLSISVLQYFRLVNLKFTGQSFSHLDNPVEFVYSPECLLSQILLHLQLNLFADATNLHSEVINDDPDFRKGHLKETEWIIWNEKLLKSCQTFLFVGAKANCYHLTADSYSLRDPEDGVRGVYVPIAPKFDVSVDVCVFLAFRKPSISTAIDLFVLIILVKTSPSDWFADCVISDTKYSLIDDVYESLAKASNSNSIKAPKNLDSFMKSILDGDLAATFSQEPPALPYIPKAFMTHEADYEELSDMLKCHYTGAPIRVLLVALHIITLRLSSSAFSQIVFGTWLTFLKYLERMSEAELLTIHPVDEAVVSFSDSPIDKTLFVISQHHLLTSCESTKSNEDEFFDAVEEQDLHHSGATPQNCLVCRRAFEELENKPIFTIANWIAPCLLAHHIRLFHHLVRSHGFDTYQPHLVNETTDRADQVVPPAIATWYGSRLKNLRKQISDHPSDYQTLFQFIKDFHRRSLCAVSLYTFFKFCGTSKEFGPVVQELSDRFHDWSVYQVSKSLLLDHFNISKIMALPLDTKTRSIIAESLTNTFDNSSGQTTIIPIFLSTDYTRQSKSELTIQGTSEESFPAYRLVSISAKHGARRPNPTLSGLTPQRLFASIRYPPTNGEEDPAIVREKLEFIRNGRSESLNVETAYKDRGSSCQILFAGCFGEDCDIR
ncbi:hypothetical protein ACTXT7_003719 [Hymenolepis weldensis]